MTWKHFFSLLTRKKWKTISKFAAALVADQMRNVYSDFMMSTRDRRVSRRGHEPACSHSQHGWGMTHMSRRDEVTEAKTQTVTRLRWPPNPNGAVICAALTGTWSPGEAAVKWSEKRQLLDLGQSTEWRDDTLALDKKGTFDISYDYCKKYFSLRTLLRWVGYLTYSKHRFGCVKMHFFFSFYSTNAHLCKSLIVHVHRDNEGTL